MENINKSFFLKNISVIAEKIPYFEIMISKFYFNYDLNFSISNNKLVDQLFEKVLIIKKGFEIKKIADKLYVPIEKNSNKKIHSIYNPIRESLDIEQNINSNICYEIYGIGFLYNLYNLKAIGLNDKKNNNFNNQPIFVLIDENLDLLLLSCCYMNIDEIFKNNRIFIYIKGIKDDFKLKSIVFSYLFDVFNPFFIDKIYIKENQNCFLKYNLSDIKEEWEGFRKELILNIKTFLINFKFELNNIIRNLSNIKNSNELKLKFENKKNFEDLKFNNKKKAIIIGASPSLDKEENIEEILKFTKDKSNLIATVDNGLNFCINHNIKPDLIFLLDSRNIAKLMFNKLPSTFKQIPIILPISCANFILNKLNNLYFFSLNYFYDIYYFIESIQKKNLLRTNFNQEALNLYRSIFENIPFINIPTKNVGAFSYLFLKYLGYHDIKTFGIDFSFFQKKYYYKESYFYYFYNSRQNYTKTTQNYNLFSVLRKGEKYLFENYISEFEKIDSKKLEFLSFNYFSFLNSDEIFNRYLLNLMSYHYIKYTEREKSEYLGKILMDKYDNLLFY